MATATVKSIGISAAILLLIAGIVWLTYHTVDTGWRNKWLLRDAADLQAQVKNAAANAAQEHDWQRQYAALDADFQSKLQAVNDEAQSTIDSYKRGNLRLRASLNCAARNMPDTATASGVRDAASECGLSSGDVEFLIRYAAKANATAKQLAAAQALLKIIYASQ